MKKIMSVRELKEYCDKNKLQKVFLHTDNQEPDFTPESWKIDLTFPMMLIHENPNLICLKSGTGTISFDRVQSVEVDTEQTVLGTVIKVFCGKFGSTEYDAAYTLIAV